MRKLKYYFYLLYVLFLSFAIFVALKHEELVLQWSWDPIDTWTGLIRFVLKLGGIGLVLFTFEIIIENIHLATKNKKIKFLEKEVLSLKAKMYDQVAEEETNGPNNNHEKEEGTGQQNEKEEE